MTSVDESGTVVSSHQNFVEGQNWLQFKVNTQYWSIMVDKQIVECHNGDTRVNLNLRVSCGVSAPS